MPKQVIALKVKIGLRPNGYADYPDWGGVLPLAQTGNTKAEKEQIAASHMIVSWHYDKTSGHQESSLDSPYGTQWGMILVTEQFAAEAEAAFPTLVFRMTETEAQDFWDNKAWGHVPENRLDRDELQALLAQRDLMTKVNRPAAEIANLDTIINQALNPDHPRIGVRKEKLKKWADAKSRLDIEIKT